MVDEQAARTRLTELLEELDRSEELLREESSGGTPGELSHLDQHPAESATLLSDNDREDAMREVVQAQREQVREALTRLDNGTYGRCVDCGRQLSDDRLDARPEAARCVTCQAKLEHAR